MDAIVIAPGSVNGTYLIKLLTWDKFNLRSALVNVQNNPYKT